MAELVVIGSSGMLGRACCEELRRRGRPFASVGRPAVDLTNPQTIGAFIEPDVNVVINCAAWTDVDGAEEDEPSATAVNGEGVAHLAARCREAGILLVHYSTDYVFDGQAGRPYAVDHPVEPVNAYGRSKAAGERAIEESGCDHLLVRTSWLYAPWGRNFVRTIARLSRERESLKVVDDQRGRPTSALHLARITAELLAKEARGTYHVCDGGDCTWFELATEVARHESPSCRVHPCTTAEFPRPAVRPNYSVLDLSRTEALLGSMPEWRTNVAEVLAQAE